MVRKTLSAAGAVAGLAYTAWGMMAIYRHQTGALPEGRIAIELLVFAVFTVPLGAAVGLGLGMLIDGLAARCRSLLGKRL